ncbi:protein translocase subunit SecA-like [Engraulis encrasicolus]|uniref:protein translocase subunit SecA-like n=1 Tax=Engraulis encrasicolus TaxID=184585 RepID=UPI002FD79C52
MLSLKRKITMDNDNEDCSMELSIPRLHCLSEHIGWKKEDVKKLFEALVDRFMCQNKKQQKVNFDKWMAKILYTIEIHKIDAAMKISGDAGDFNVVQLVQDSTIDDPKLFKLLESEREQNLEEILKDIARQHDGVHDNLIEKVRAIVSNVSKALKQNNKKVCKDGMEETLFDICKAVQAQTKHWKPRYTQMVSWCILALSHNSYLLQVGTGEGKSCIVAMFAAYRALKGQKVDIISSSPVLAERDVEEWKVFYEQLGLTVNCNTNKSEEQLKKCYKCHVVYGTTENFAGDWLRHHFNREYIRTDRKFECVIVDEVDSLMLDKGLEVVYLSSTMPAMQCLDILLSRIWFQVDQHKKMSWGETAGPIRPFVDILQECTGSNVQPILKLAEDRGIFPTGFAKEMTQPKSQDMIQKLECISQSQIVDFFKVAKEKLLNYSFSLFQEDGQQKVNMAQNGDEGDRHKISLLFLKGGLCRRLFPDKEACINSVEQTIKEDLQFICPEVTPEDSPIPGMQHFIKAKLRVWVLSAFQAKEMDLGDEYIIQGQSVVPVDYTCTGVVQNNMRWSNGLQQFIEMKHQAKLSNMTAITNFMSNVRLFRMYKSQVYGISGTLGNKEEVEMLGELYKGMQTCVIPSFKRRKLFEETGQVERNEEDWLSEICSAVKEKVSATSYRGERAVLVICETINRAKTIEKAITNSLSDQSIHIKVYTNSNLDSTEITGRPLQPRDVIIATNLAGRGTDLKVSQEVNASGGLFVLQTFLPLNIRVENQAFGRSGRQGNPGSAQLIMCFDHFSASTIVQMFGNTSLLQMLAQRIMHLHMVVLEICGEHVKRRLSEVLKEFIKQENNSQQSREEMIATLDIVVSSLKNPNKAAVIDAKMARDSLVEERMSSYLREDIPKMTKKEDLFSDYLKLLDELYKKHKNSKKLDAIVESMHECWGLWLLMRFNENETEETLKTTFRNAMKYAQECLERGKSPSSALSFYTRYGNELRVQGRFGESIGMYTRAVEENDTDAIALYNRALSVMHAKDQGYITAALQDLEKASESVKLSKNIIEEKLVNVVILQADQLNGEKTGFIKQLQLKNQLLTGLKDNIDEAVQKLKDARNFGKRVKISEYPVSFLLSEIRHLVQLFCSVGLPQSGLHPLLHQLKVNEELKNLEALGLTQVFCLETTISLSGFFSKIFKAD